MKSAFPSVPQLYRNVRRWTEIVSVMSKYGLADWLSRFNIDFITDLLHSKGEASQSQLTHNARIRMTLTELGPTFIKFGQLLSIRPDLIGTELAEELSKLQSDIPHDPFDVIKEIVEQEQGQPIEELFEYFSEEPIASASIGQVHLARLHPHMVEDSDPKKQSPLGQSKNGQSAGSDQETNGSSLRENLGEKLGRALNRPTSQQPSNSTLDVVVKVQHHGIERVIDTDLDILAGLAQLASRLDDFKNYQPVSIVREMSRTMRRELDFEREERNLMQFRSLFKDDPSVIIPEPTKDLCSSRMLTMERIRGTKLGDMQEAPPAGVDAAEVARDGANLYLKMIFTHGFYHADPHPGNIVITDSGTIGLLDFGMVGRISEQLREDIEAMLVAIVNQDVPMLSTLIKRVGNCPVDLNDALLSNDIADFVGQYSTQIMSHFDMSGALNDFMNVVRNNEITLPSEASLLIKVLVGLEGTAKILNPQFSLMEIMKPFHRMLIMKRLSPTRQLRKMRRFYMEVEQLVDALPQRVSNILEQVQTGRFDVHLVHRRLGPTANRLVVGLMTSALFLGSSLMLSYKVPPLFFPGKGPLGIQDLSFLGLTGFFVSILMGLRLMWAIRKSGNLDTPE
ncbi:MAG: ABC1 kinase family protein [Mariniblastus sp.]